MIKKSGWLSACLLLLIQTGCSTSSYIYKANDVNAWQQTRAELEKINSWDVRGKISIRSGEDLYTADLYWQQNHHDLNMRLVAPFSQAVTHFSGSDDKGYQVVTEQGELFDVDSPETVTENAFGVTLPFHELKSWIRGVPDRESPVWKVKFNSDNRLQAFEQSGWQIEILKYKSVDGRLLPSKVFLSRLNDYLADKKVDVRLILRRWII